MLKVGDELGRYEIIAHLKSGGMAALYLGRRKDPPDNGIFAIKVVHPHLLDDQQLVQMFLDEARLSSRIAHNNVVRVQEMGEEKHVHYLVMEYVHGCSLAQLLQALIRRGRRMQPELAVHIAMHIAEGLHAAHETKDHLGEPLHVVHRDVSPQNVLLSHTGDVKLIDFGIAKSRARMHHSMTGVSIRGKLRYMSPEHARGKSVDRRTDVYALGIVLWEMLTMRPLFWAETDFEVLRKVQDPHIDPPSRYAPGVPPELDEALLRCLDKERDKRPYTAMEMRQLLARALPFAEALDADQVAELLDAMLGDELMRTVDDIPQEASITMGLPRGRESKPVPEKAIQELTMELRDEGISADSFAEDWDDYSESEVSTLDEAMEEPVSRPQGSRPGAGGVAARSAAGDPAYRRDDPPTPLAKLPVARPGGYDDEEEATATAVAVRGDADEPIDEPTELMPREELDRLQATMGLKPKPQAPVPAHQAQGKPTARDQLLDISVGDVGEAEATVVEAHPPSFGTAMTPAPPPTPELQDYEDDATTLKKSRELLAGPKPFAPPPPPEWAGYETDDASAERLALIVGAAVAAVLLALVGFFVLF